VDGVTIDWHTSEQHSVLPSMICPSTMLEREWMVLQ